MRTFGLSALAIGLCAALLVGCGGSQQPISPPGAMPESHTVASSYQVLYSFKGPPDGESPFANLIDVNGTLYSTTGYGGASADGTAPFILSRRTAPSRCCIALACSLTEAAPTEGLST